MKKITYLKKPIACAIGLMIASGAIAQDQEKKPARKGAAATMLEEVMVKSRKRSAAEAVQDVPLSITAYGGDQLDAMFVKKLEDLSYSAPNVQLDQVGTFPGVQNFSIRGQGINSSIPSVDPTVGTFINGVYLGVTYGVVVDMFDMESVEILRGPQGLLFGRNVTGGAVVMRTARPNGEFGFRARAQATDSDQYNIAGAIEGSLIEDKLAAKLTVYYDDDQGYYDNETTGPTPGAFYVNPAKRGDFGEMKTTFIRPTLVWQASTDLEITFIGESGESEGDGAAWTSASGQRDGILDEFTTTLDEAGDTDMTWDQLTVEANMNVGFGNDTITNILGWREVDAYSVADVDGTSTPFFTVPGTTEQDQISNELRFAGTFMGDKLDLTTGIYYFEQDISYRESRYIAGGGGIPAAGIPGLVALGGDMDHETWGFFVNNDYHLTDALTITAGLRYTEEDKEASVIDSSLATCPDVINFNCTFVDLEDDWSNWTPKVGFDYALTDSSTVYAFWTKGFRSGGVNFRNAKPNVIAPGPTKEEEQQSYEVGVKSQLLDGSVRLNAAYFYNTVDDMQRELNLPDAQVVVLQGTVNAGDVTIQGVEIDVVALLTDNFAVNGSVGYLDGSYDKVNPTYAAFIGEDLPRLSPWTASIGASYDLSLGDMGSMSFRGSYSFRDAAAYNDSNTENFEQQHEANASINYLSPDEHWTLSLFGKNLNDEARWGNLTTIPGGYTAGPMQKGRVIGVESEYRY